MKLLFKLLVSACPQFLTLFVIMAVAIAVDGCVHFPSDHAASPETSSMATKLSTLTSRLQTKPGTSLVKSTVDKQSVMLDLCAIVCLLLAALAIYNEHFFTAGLFGLAFLALPIVAVIWSLFYAYIIAGGIIAVAVAVFIHYRAVILPALTSIEQKIVK